MAGRSVSEEIRFGVRWGLIVGGSAAALLLLSYAVAAWVGISQSSLYRSPIPSTDWYVGAISNAGILILTAGSAAALFSATLLRGSDRRSVRGYLVWMGLLALVMVLDDLFGLHDFVLPWRLGIDKRFAYLAYGIALLLIVGLYRRIVATTHVSLLALAAAAMVASVVIDQLQPAFSLPTLVGVAEDPAKFVAWVFFATYLARTGRDAILSRIDRKREERSVAEANVI